MLLYSGVRSLFANDMSGTLEQTSHDLTQRRREFMGQLVRNAFVDWHWPQGCGVQVNPTKNQVIEPTEVVRKLDKHINKEPEQNNGQDNLVFAASLLLEHTL